MSLSHVVSRPSGLPVVDAKTFEESEDRTAVPHEVAMPPHYLNRMVLGKSWGCQSPMRPQPNKIRAVWFSIVNMFNHDCWAGHEATQVGGNDRVAGAAERPRTVCVMRPQPRVGGASRHQPWAIGLKPSGLFGREGR